ncbi:MAG: polyisoprenyl-teichoic acid--peptidoglycan teichoic acid transferase [Gaiellaceae bacterium]|nr:polyisoprenyl-teichoic acid--peptidoglycan teichoic acid transferase [Gaiellaceae bacterium]
MRTTLKRGIGRGATVNGNGRAVLPPGPPSTPIAMTRYRQPEPEGRGFARAVGRILFLLAAAVVMVALATGGGYYLFLHESVSSLRAVSADVKKAQHALQVPEAHQPTVALIVGYDQRKGSQHMPSSRSDTIMLVRADPGTNTISLLSFPRDLLVSNYCPGKTPWTDRINAAYSICGARGTLATVQRLTNVPINYLITVNFSGFRQIVDRLGGIWVDVDRRYYNKNIGTFATDYANINLLPGYQKLNGSNALDYVRFRHTDSDLYRLARQQNFVQGIKERITDSFLPTTIPRVVGGITRNHNVEVAEGGKTQLDFKTVLSYAFFAYKLPAGHLFQVKIGDLTGLNELQAPQASIDDAIDKFLHPDVQAGAKAAASALGKKYRAGSAGPRPADVTISVLNGNGVTGSAHSASTALAGKGYTIVPPRPNVLPNAPTFTYFHTEVYFDPLHAGSRQAARKVAATFGDGVVKSVTPAFQSCFNGALLCVVVGKTFQGTLAPTVRDQTPKHAPPYIRTDPNVTLSALKQVRKRVPFKLMLPTVLERASNLDTLRGEVPVRVYPILKGHRAVRLTYLSGSDLAGYWGIEQTDWTDAPILRQPSETRTIGGRRFDLYFTGASLHMVVLRANGASYWVVNTLLNSLSNETILAIAKGLKPLSK